jgi:16S rRNA (cytosine967-C5)-methyltransferase
MRHPEFMAMPAADVTRPLGERALVFQHAALMTPEGLLMTPRRTETDGFFVSVLLRRAEASAAATATAKEKSDTQATVTEW